MKILSVHNRYRSVFPSGEDLVVDQEREALGAAGHTVDRFERSSDDISGLPVSRKALIPAQVVWSEHARRSLRRTLQELQPDVVHVHSTFPLLSASVLYSCRAERTPVVVTLHNYGLVCASGDLFRAGSNCDECVGRHPMPAVRHGCYRDSSLATVPVAASLFVHRRAWRTMVSAYVCLSHVQSEIVSSDGFPRERIFCKPNFVPRSLSREPLPEDIVVYVGRLSTQKGVPLLFDAWDRYGHQAREPGLRLVLAGAGPLEGMVKTWTSERPSAEWIGKLSRPECASLMARARAVIIPTESEEPFGLVVVEAMAAGVPAVAPAHGACPELITNGADGVLFTPGDAKALSAVLCEIDEQPDCYAALGRAAHRTYERRFTPEVNVEQLLAIYRFAIENPAH